jgi:hypothetical protein
LRQQAVAEIDRVVEQFGHKHNLSIDILQRYRMTLLDNSYLPVPEYVPATLKFHQRIEQELKKTATFTQLWPDLAGRLS